MRLGSVVFEGRATFRISEQVTMHVVEELGSMRI